MARDPAVEPSVSEWGQSVLNASGLPPVRDVPIEGDTGYYNKGNDDPTKGPLVERILDDTTDVPFDAAMLERQKQAAQQRGAGVPEGAPEPLYPPDALGPEPLYQSRAIAVSKEYAKQRSQLDSVILGDTSIQKEAESAYSNGADTIQNYIIETLESKYTEEMIDRGVLEEIYNKPVEEQVERLN